MKLRIFFISSSFSAAACSFAFPPVFFYPSCQLPFFSLPLALLNLRVQCLHVCSSALKIISRATPFVNVMSSMCQCSVDCTGVKSQHKIFLRYNRVANYLYNGLQSDKILIQEIKTRTTCSSYFPITSSSSSWIWLLSCTGNIPSMAAVRCSGIHGDTEMTSRSFSGK